MVPEEQGRQVCLFSFVFKGSKRRLRQRREWETTSARVSISRIWFLEDLSQGFTEKPLWSHTLVGKQGTMVLSIWNLGDWMHLQMLRIADLANGIRILTPYPDGASGKAFAVGAATSSRWSWTRVPGSSWLYTSPIRTISLSSLLRQEDNPALACRQTLRFSTIRQLILKSPVQTIIAHC